MALAIGAKDVGGRVDGFASQAASKRRSGDAAKETRKDPKRRGALASQAPRLACRRMPGEGDWAGVER